MESVKTQIGCSNLPPGFNHLGPVPPGPTLSLGGATLTSNYTGMVGSVHLYTCVLERVFKILHAKQFLHSLFINPDYKTLTSAYFTASRHPILTYTVQLVYMGKRSQMAPDPHATARMAVSGVPRLCFVPVFV